MKTLTLLESLEMKGERGMIEEINRLVAAERERCAKFIEDMDDGPITTKAVKTYVSAAIRDHR